MIRKAQRQQAKLRLGLMGPAGSGKTFSALQMAFGLGGKIGLIDTERGSGDLYSHLGDYDVIQIHAPYEIKKYLAAIHEFEKHGYDVIIIDSLSHAWAGEGGLLEKVDKIKGNSPNSFGAWRQVTPEHNALVEALLQSPAHIIATMRSKTEYVLETNDKGKQVPRKVGMAPVQRDGMEYEFTVVLDISDAHIAHATKDRTSTLDGSYFKVTAQTGAALKEWLNGAAPRVVVSNDAPPDHDDAPEPGSREPDEYVDADGVVHDRDSVLAEMRKNQDAWRIEQLLTRNAKTEGDVTRIVKAENNLAAINSWPEPWKDVMREIVREAKVRVNGNRPPAEQAA